MVAWYYDSPTKTWTHKDLDVRLATGQLAQGAMRTAFRMMVSEGGAETPHVAKQFIEGPEVPARACASSDVSNRRPPPPLATTAPPPTPHPNLNPGARNDQSRDRPPLVGRRVGVCAIRAARVWGPGGGGGGGGGCSKMSYSRHKNSGTC